MNKWLCLTITLASFLLHGCGGSTATTDALLDAIGRSAVVEVRKLLDEGADPNRKNWDGVLPLAAAARARSGEIVQILIHRRADPNMTESGASPLYFAVLFECSDCAQFIANAGGKFVADEGQLSFLRRTVSADKLQELNKYIPD